MRKEEPKVDGDWKKLVADTLEVRVTPKSSSNRIKAEIHNGQLLIKVHVTVAPENDKANRSVIDLLAKELNLPRSSLTIISGHHSRKKVIRIN